MIKYDRFWVTMKERGITQYDLYEHYQITRSLLDRLRKNKNVEIYTIDRLCSILHCEIEDIVEHIPEPDEMNEKTDTKNYTSSSKDDKNSLTVKECSFSSAVSSMSERVFYVIITFLLSSSILFLKVISAILSKKNPFHSLSGNFTRFICVQGFFHTIYLFSLNKIYDLFVVYDLSEIWFQGSATYKTAIDVSLSE